MYSNSFGPVPRLSESAAFDLLEPSEQFLGRHAPASGDLQLLDLDIAVRAGYFDFRPAVRYDGSGDLSRPARFGFRTEDFDSDRCCVRTAQLAPRGRIRAQSPDQVAYPGGRLPPVDTARFLEYFRSALQAFRVDGRLFDGRHGSLARFFRSFRRPVRSPLPSDGRGACRRRRRDRSARASGIARLLCRSRGSAGRS